MLKLRAPQAHLDLESDILSHGSLSIIVATICPLPFLSPSRAQSNYTRVYAWMELITEVSCCVRRVLKY